MILTERETRKAICSMASDIERELNLENIDSCICYLGPHARCSDVPVRLNDEVINFIREAVNYKLKLIAQDKADEKKKAGMPDLIDNEILLLVKGNIVSAIVAYRNRTGGQYSLVTCKEKLEKVRAELKQNL